MALLYYALRVRRGCGQLVLWCYLTIADFHSSPGCCVSSIEASVEKVVMSWRLPVARYAVSLWQFLLSQ